MVDNVEESIALLESTGSKIVLKMDFGGGQFIAWFTDPAGNILGIYQHAVEKVMANGGKIVQPIGVDAPEISARFSDPFGNVLGLYQNPV